MRSVDLMVVGGGIAAGSLVYNLLKQGFKGSILVAERLDALAQSNTAKSAGGFRNLWTTEVNQQLCTRSFDILKHFKEEMGTGLGFQPSGYLFCYYAESWAKIPQAAEIWSRNKVRYELLDPAGIEARIPGLRCSVDDMDPEVREFLGFEAIAGGVLGLDCGSFDPSQAALGYFERAADFTHKPEIHLNTEVESIVFNASGKAVGARLKNAAGAVEEMSVGMVALCNGPWANELLSRSGLPEADLMPIITQKRMMFVTDFPDADPRWKDIPLTIIDQGIYFKNESGNLLIGKARPDEPDSFDTTFESDYYVEEVNLPMQERIPSTAVCKLKTGWAGLYDTTGPDHNAILGWHAHHENLLLQVGYSGHGAMESPAAGICLAELVLEGRARTVDITPLRWSRFQEGDLVKETIVI